MDKNLKKCSCCGVLKPIEQFHKAGGGHIKCACKDCTRDIRNTGYRISLMPLYAKRQIVGRVIYDCIKAGEFPLSYMSTSLLSSHPEFLGASKQNLLFCSSSTHDETECTLDDFSLEDIIAHLRDKYGVCKIEKRKVETEIIEL